MPRIGLGQGGGAIGQCVAGEDRGVRRTGNAKVIGQGGIPGKQAGRGHRRRVKPGEKRRGQAGKAVVEGDVQGHGTEVGGPAPPVQCQNFRVIRR